MSSPMELTPTGTGGTREEVVLKKYD